MATNVIMPQLGETVSEGKILSWFVAVGDDIKVGDRLFEVETDKVTIEVEAVNAGKVSNIAVGEGETADIGAVVAVLDGEAGGDAPVPAAKSSDSEPPAPERPAVTSPAPSPVSKTASLAPFEEVITPLDNHGPAAGPEGMRFSPLARRVMAQNGVDPADMASYARSKSLKKVREADVQAFLRDKPAPSRPTSAPAPQPDAATSGEGEVITLNTMRARTGEKLAENWRTIPHVFQAIDVDFTEVESVRSRQKQRFKAENGVSLTYLPFIAYATCMALKEYPQVNGRFDGKSVFVPRDINLGIAVDLSFNGLVVPVVRGAGDLSLVGLAKAINRQIAKARDGKLTADDFAGGTYSITNNGAFGTSFTAPIINAPQVAILSTDAIRKKPAVVSTPQGDFVAPRLIGTVGQCFDHRAFDGAYSAAFLSKLRDIIEKRDWAAEFPS